MTAIYSNIGENYSLHRKADQRIVDTLYFLLGLPNKSVVADIGAGSGNYSNAIANKGHLVYAIEPSVKMLSQANFHCNVKWIQSTAEQIPIRNNKDIESGAWDTKYGSIRGKCHFDLGYRFIKLKRK